MRFVGESVGHDLARRGDDVIDRRAQVVERFDVGHEAVVEEQEVEAVGQCREGVGQLRDVHLVTRVAERSGGVGPGCRLPVLLRSVRRLQGSACERAGRGRYPGLAVAADDEPVTECGGLVGQLREERVHAFGVSGVELRVGLHLACGARGAVWVVVEFEQFGRALVCGLPADEDAPVARGVGIDGAADSLDVLFEVAGQAPAGHVEQQGLRRHGRALLDGDRQFRTGLGHEEVQRAEAGPCGRGVRLRCRQGHGGCAAAAVEGRGVESRPRYLELPRPAGRHVETGGGSRLARQHDLLGRERKARFFGLVVRAARPEEQGQDQQAGCKPAQERCGHL